MAKNFGIKFLTLQLGMIIFGVLLFIALYHLKTAQNERKAAQQATEAAENSEASEAPEAHEAPVLPTTPRNK